MAGQNILRKLNAAKAGAPASGAGGVLRALSLGPLAAYSIPGFAEQKAQNRADVIEMSKGPLNELQYIGGQLLQGRLPYTGPSQRAQQTGQYGRYSPPDTQERSWLYSGGAAESSGAAPAAKRAYQQEVSRVAQLTAQDPELQRYQAATKEAAKFGPGSAAEQSAEDMGMQMWAKANPKLAAKVKPGQAGYDVIQNTLAGNAARAGAGFKLPDQLVPTPAGFPTAVPAFTQTAPGGYDRGFGITTNLAPGATLQALQPTPTAMPAASPTFNLGAAFGQPGVLDEETLKRFSDILLQSAK